MARAGFFKEIQFLVRFFCLVGFMNLIGSAGAGIAGDLLDGFYHSCAGVLRSREIFWGD